MGRADDRVRELHNELGYQPDEITSQLLREQRLTDEASAFFYPWIRDRVQHLISRWGRQGSTDSPGTEDRARQHAEGHTRTISQAIPASQVATDPRLRFLDCQVPCRGAPGGMKLYRDFTAADHQARITVHESNLRGAMDRISGHRWAVKELQNHHATTLGAIPVETLLADLPRGGIRA